MNDTQTGVGQSSHYVDGSTGTIGTRGLESPLRCTCDGEKIFAVHAYLKRHFPHCVIGDLHAPTRLMREGVLMGRGDYHVVSVATDRPSHAVLLNECFQCPVGHLEERLWEWNLAAALRAHRIVVVGKDGVSAL
jgi:hypothetical protein